MGKLKPGSCSTCGGPLDGMFRCDGETCGYRRSSGGPVVAGRYRHPVNADGNPCGCNSGHVTQNSVR